NRRVIEAADGVVGQLLRCDLAARESAHIDDGDKLLHTGGPCALDAVVAGHDLEASILLCQEGQTLKLATVLDIRRELVMHLLLHDAGIDVLLSHLIELYLCDDEASPHIVDFFISYCRCALLSCHFFSLLSHSDSVAFSSLSSIRSASYVSLYPLVLSSCRLTSFILPRPSLFFAYLFSMT